MARKARVVVPGFPHHVVQRGNRRQKVIFSDKDKQAYIDCLIDYAKPAGLEFWAYCIMDNHIHLIVVPKEENSLAKGLSKAHWSYTRMINFRENWRGYLWEGRFKSCALDEKHLYAAMRYVERNPVRAKIVSKASDYPWSSAIAHIYKTKSNLLADNFLVQDVKNWFAYLEQEDRPIDLDILRQSTSTQRPIGDAKFVAMLEKITGKILHKQKPGPKNKIIRCVSPE